MKKIMLLADSCGLPRSFPVEAVTPFENTYPQMVMKEFKDATFFDLCMGGVTAPDLIGQAISYFNHWQPDVIIVQVGIDDCRPEPMSTFFRILLTEIDIFARLRAFIYKPAVMKRLIKLKPSYRVTPRKFKRNIKKLKMVFPDAEILWMEIFTSESGGYEEHRPGVLKRIDQYNKIIKKELKDGFVEIQAELNSRNGIHTDHLHLNTIGHEVITDILKNRLKSI